MASGEAAEPAGAPVSSDRQLGFLWGGVVLALIALSPLAPKVASGLWSCPFKSVFGIPCPTCGAGRAALALARLDPVEALARYPLPAFAWIAFLAGGLAAAWRAWRGLPLPSLRRLPAWVKVGVVVAVVANWAYSIATGV